ncbi:MAG: hypothetical protein ACE5PM_09835, partial [Candidatus Hydrothermarchaeales archaeon]
LGIRMKHEAGTRRKTGERGYVFLCLSPHALILTPVFQQSMSANLGCCLHTSLSLTLSEASLIDMSI